MVAPVGQNFAAKFAATNSALANAGQPTGFLSPQTPGLNASSLTIQQAVAAQDAKTAAASPKDVFGRPVQQKNNAASINGSGIAIFYNRILKNNWKQAMTPRNKYRGLWTSPNISPQSGKLVDALNGSILYIDNVDIPKVTLTGDSIINDGRGVYHVHGDSIPSAEGGVFTMVFRETQTPIIELVVDPWLQYNATPFQRPIYFNFYVQMISDTDGYTATIDYLLTGVRPLSYRTPKPDHGHKAIMLREVTFMCNCVKPNVLVGSTGQILANTQNTGRTKTKQTKATSAGFFKTIYNAIAG